MKSLSAQLPVVALVLLVSFGTFLVACKESPHGAQEEDDSDMTTPAPVVREPTSTQERVAPEEADTTEEAGPLDEQIAELRSVIESRQQNVEDMEAFVQMERAKLKEDSDYDQSFLLDALDKQQEIKDAIESNKKRLEELER